MGALRSKWEVLFFTASFPPLPFTTFNKAHVATNGRRLKMFPPESCFSSSPSPKPVAARRKNAHDASQHFFSCVAIFLPRVAVFLASRRDIFSLASRRNPQSVAKEPTTLFFFLCHASQFFFSHVALLPSRVLVFFLSHSLPSREARLPTGLSCPALLRQVRKAKKSGNLQVAALRIESGLVGRRLRLGMHRAPLHVDGTERTGRTQVLTGAAAYAAALVDSRNP